MMTKKEILDQVLKVSGVDSKQALAVLSAYQVVVIKALKKDREVSLMDLGKMKIVHKKARNGVNPQTGKAITVPERDAPKLTCSKKLKSFVDGSGDVKEADFRF